MFVSLPADPFMTREPLIHSATPVMRAASLVFSESARAARGHFICPRVMKICVNVGLTACLLTLLAGCERSESIGLEGDHRLVRAISPPEIADETCACSSKTPPHREKIRFSRANPYSAEILIRDAYRDLESGHQLLCGPPPATIPRTNHRSGTTLVATEGDDEKKSLEESIDEPSEPADNTESNKKPSPPSKFDGEFDPSEVDADEDAGVGPSASDWRKAEVVPTPVPNPEIVAEVVPTPFGMPEKVQIARKPPVTSRSRADVIAVSPAGPDSPITASPVIAAVSGKPAKPTPAKPTPAADDSPRIAASPKDAARSNAGKTGESMSDDTHGNDSDTLDQAVVATAGSAANIGNALEGPVDYKNWPTPDLTIFVTGQQHGYIEPCGCTGLENQKGGVARRMSFAEELKDEGWELLPVDAGNLIRRYGSQAEIKFHRSLEALRKMGYVAVGFGPDDVRLAVVDLIQEAAAEKPEDAVYASANVVLLDPSLMPTYRLVERAGMKIAVTSILDPKSLEARLNEDIMLGDPVQSAKDVMEQIQAESPDYTVLTYYGKEESAANVAQQVPGFDLVVVAGGYGEPTYQPESVKDSKSKMILTGNKGMYVGLVGLYKNVSSENNGDENTDKLNTDKLNTDMKYARVALDDSFGDAPEMRRLMSDYQIQLRDLGLENLGLKPIPHPTGGKFVGAQACGECHTTAYGIWENSMHFHATESLVHPGERGDVPRHFDPECISCHVTGWNPQNYYPYVSGYLDLKTHEHLHGNGCENCHGPGATHTAAEHGTIDVTEEQRTQLREAMRLPLERAREKCMECHDLDNSPDFHEEDAFDDYWAEVEHYGMD